MGVMICIGQGGLRSLSASSYDMKYSLHVFPHSRQYSYMNRGHGRGIDNVFRL